MDYTRDPEQRELQILQEFVDFSGAQVLEVGCGAGQLTWRYAPLARRVVGIDMAVETLHDAEVNRPDSLMTPVELMVASGERLPFPDEAFDVVLFGASL